MRAERLDHTLQPTAVVHQLYLELVKVEALRPADSEGADEKAAFLGLAAYLIKQLLIHHARTLSKRAEKVELLDLPGPPSSTEHSLIEIDDALNRLAAINPALRRVVELRVFEGLTREEIARELGCGTATVARHWSFPETGWRKPSPGRQDCDGRTLETGIRHFRKSRTSCRTGAADPDITPVFPFGSYFIMGGDSPGTGASPGVQLRHRRLRLLIAANRSDASFQNPGGPELE